MATPGTDEGLLIPIQFSLEEARAALAQLEAQARAAGVRVGEGVGKGAKEGLGALKTQMGQSREAAMFFTQALGEFGPQGRTAQIAISGIAGAILGGGGVLAALSLAQAGARLLVDAWNDSGEQAKKASAEAKKAAEDIAAAIKDARERVQAATFQLSNTPESEQFRRKTLEKAKSDLADVEFEILESNKRRRAALAQRNSDEAAAWAARIATAQARLPGLRELATLAGKQYDRLLGAEEVAEVKKRWDALDSAAEEHAKNLASALAGQEREDFVARERLLSASQTQSAALSEAFLKERARAFAGYTDFLFGQIQERFDRLPAGPNIPKPGEGETADAQAFLEAARIRKEALDDLRASAVGAYQSMARAAVSAFGPMLTGSRAHAAALRAQGVAVRDTADLSAAAFAAMLQNVLASLAQESLIKALFQTAEGLAAAATGNPGAAAHFAAAAKYAAVAGIAGAGALAIGNTRGMTAAERADVAAQTPVAPETGGAREVGSGFAGATAAVHTQTIIVIPGSPFETAQEQARRAQRTLALMADLNMLPRS